MPFRAPKNFWEWVLLFSPAMVIWIAAAILFAIVRYDNGVGAVFVNPVVWSYVAFALSIIVGHIFTKPNPNCWVWSGWSFVAAILVVLLNYAVAYAGCAIVTR